MVFVQNGTAQEVLSLRFNPSSNYGYMVWDSQSENVAYYRLNIHKVTYGASDTLADELFDSQGNVQLVKNFFVPKDHSGNHSINTLNPLPNGFLYHKFTFEDGSYKTYTTLNQ
jgi:hypothetical protein